MKGFFIVVYFKTVKRHLDKRMSTIILRKRIAARAQSPDLKRTNIKSITRDLSLQIHIEH